MPSVYVRTVSAMTIFLEVAQPEQALLRLRRKEGCRARYSQKWLIGVKRSALETRFVLAEGTHQSRCLFGEFLAIWIHIYDYRGRSLTSPLAALRWLLTSRPAEGSKPAPPRLLGALPGEVTAAP